MYQCDGKSVTPDENDVYYELCNKLLSKAGIEVNGNKSYDIHVNNNGFYKRVIEQGRLGLGESYMDGWWDCKRIDVFIKKLITANVQNEIRLNFQDIIRIMIAKIFNLQTKARAFIIGRKHYDLGNDLFHEILDPHMQYSCGYWNNANNLNTAQENKLKLICEKLQLTRGMRVLDIGCGWGGLAKYAAENYGVSVVGITVSEEQHKYASEYCKEHDVKILLLDYRDIDDQFDRIVSVGMFEHVGHKNYSTFFSVVDRNLKKDGLFLLHCIGTNKLGLCLDPWMNKYIFPNGSIPSIIQIAMASEPHFIMEDLHNFGSDYDKTLLAWDKKFKMSWKNIENNYSARFFRMFTYYLNYCAGAFRARNVQLWQILFSKGIEGGIRVPR